MSDLLKELEQQHNIQIETKEVDEQYEQSYDENQYEKDELENDLAKFDKKIQGHKEAQKIQNGNYSNDDENSDEDSYYGKKYQQRPIIRNNDQNKNTNNNNNQDNDDDEELRNIIRMKMQQGNQEKPQKKVLFGTNPEIPPAYNAPNIEKIQQNIMTQQKAKQQSSEEYQIQEVLNSGSDSLKERKIKELAQKNRNLQVQYEREKALRSKMEKQLNQMIKDNEEVIKYREEKMGITGQQDKPKLSTTKSSMNQTNNHNFSSAQSEMSYDGLSQADVDFKKKFQMADKKVQELRVNFQNLKNELNKAHRVISREIGDNFNIDQALSEENGWKGRAQTIEKLKAKIRDLNGKIENSTMYSQCSTIHENQQFQFQNGGTQKLDKGAAERRKELQNLQEKYKKLQEEYDMVISKLKANQSRKTTLEVELKDIKSDFEKNKKVLLAKSNADDQYIQALKSEYERLKKSKNDTKVIYKNQCDLEHVNPAQHEKDRKQIRNLQEELNIKEGMISELIEEKLQAEQKMQQMGIKNSSALSQKSQQNNIQQSPSKLQQQQLQGGLSSQDFEMKIKKLQEEIKILRKERADFFSENIKDKDSRMIIKDLSMQNAQLRSKVDNLQQSLNKN